MLRDAKARKPLFFLAMISSSMLFSSGTLIGAGKLNIIIGSNDNTLISDVAFSPNGEMLAICCSQEKDDVIRSFVKIHALDKNAKPSQAIVASVQGLCHSVAFSPDGINLIVSQLSILDFQAKDKPIASNDIVSWHIKDRRRVMSADANKCCVAKLIYSPNRQILATGCSDGRIVLRKANTLEILDRLGESDGGISSLAFSSDGAELISCSTEGTVRVWDISKKRVTNSFSVEKANRTQLVLSSEGKTVAAIDRDSNVKLIDRRSGKNTLTIHQKKQVICCAFSKNNDIVALGNKEGNIVLYSCADGKKVDEIGVKAEPISIVLSPNGKFVVVITEVMKSQHSNSIILWAR